MTLGLMNAFLILKTIAGFPRFYSLNTYHLEILKPATFNKPYKDQWFFIGGSWLVASEPICGRVRSHFGESGKVLHFALFYLSIFCVCGRIQAS